MRDGRGLGWSPALDGSEFMSFRELVCPAFWSDLQWIGEMAGSGRILSCLYFTRLRTKSSTIHHFNEDHPNRGTIFASYYLHSSRVRTTLHDRLEKIITTV